MDIKESIDRYLIRSFALLDFSFASLYTYILLLLFHIMYKIALTVTQNIFYIVLNIQLWYFLHSTLLQPVTN